MNGFLRHLRLVALIGVAWLCASAPYADSWAPMASISPTTSLVTNSLCYTDGTDIACNGTGPATGGLSSDRITSSTSGVFVSSTGVISLATNGTTPGYINAAGLTINGISATGTISGTTGYFSGLVGIGTTAPSGTLHVFGAGNPSAIILSRSTSAISQGSWDYNSSTMRFGTTGTDHLGLITSNTTRLYISSAGLVGISTSTPSTTLHVNGTLRIADGGEACDTNRAGSIKYASGTFYTCDGSTGWTALGSAGSASADRIISGTTQAIAYSNTSLSLVTAGVERVVVGTTGNVGIGQQPTSAGLSVSGSIFANNNIVAATNFASPLGISISNSSAAMGIGVASGATQYSAVAKSGDSILRNYSGSGNLILSNQTSDGNILFTSGVGTDTEKMRIVSTGLVGIGTPTPATALDVSGSISTNSWLTITYARPFVRFVGVSNTNLVMRNSGNMALSTDRLAIGSGGTALGFEPQTQLDISGTLRIADSGEACDTNRAGAIKYASGIFYTCAGSSWAALGSGSASADRIISGTTQAIAYSNTSLSLVTAGTERVVIGTTGNVGIGQQPAAGLALSVSGSGVFTSYVSSSNIRYNTAQSSIGILGTPSTWCGSCITLGSGGGYTMSNNTFAQTASNAIMWSTNTTDPGNTQVGSVNVSSGPSLMTLSTGTGSSINHTMMLTSSSAFVGVTQLSITPSTTLDISGTMKISDSGEACDANRKGAIKYSSGTFYTCDGSTGWTALGSAGSASTDRITSGTTNVTAYTTGKVTLNTAGLERISVDSSGQVGINQSPTSGVVLSASGTVQIGSGSGDSRINMFGTNTGQSFSIGNAINVNASNTNLILQGYFNQGTVRVNGGVVDSGGSPKSQFSVSGTTIITSWTSIGTLTYPTAALDVAGNIKSAGAIAATGTVTAGTYFTPGPNSFFADGLLSVGYAYGSTISAAMAVNGNVGIGAGLRIPSTTLHVAGTIRIADGGEACDTNRAGAIKYASGIFYTCAGSSWAAFGSGATTDRITSSTTAAVIANSSGGTVSFTLGGTAGAAYLHPTLGLVAPGVSTTGPISGSAAYFSNPGTGYYQRLYQNGSTSALELKTLNSYSAQLYVSEGSQLVLANGGADRVTINSNGTVGIGTSSPGSYMLYVAGNSYTTGSWSTSDARYKENIQPMSGLLAKVSKLRPVTFTWKKNAFPAKDNPGEQIGLIAQEVEKVYPELVHTNSDGYKAVAYDKLGVLLLGAVKDLSAENQRLSAENAALKQQNDNFETRLRKLEAAGTARH